MKRRKESRRIIPSLPYADPVIGLSGNALLQQADGLVIIPATNKRSAAATRFSSAHSVVACDLLGRLGFNRV